MGLIKKARVPISSQRQERIGKINDKHVDRYCKPKKTVPPPPPQASTQFSDQQLLYHIMD
ncbi:hypothetical protein A2U01_0117394, partial [Trifolium medium]|nr:hypothetical protein [Trifolium medium]